MQLDKVLQEIQNRIYNKLGSTQETYAAITPLEWYIKTGRAPLEFEKLLKACKSRQLTTIANKLIKYNHGDYQAAIDSICKYLGFQRYT